MFVLSSDQAAVWTPENVAYWVENYKTAIVIMGLAVPSTAMYIAHHRSVHQDKLMTLQRDSNTRTNYFDVYREFEDGYKEFKLSYEEAIGTNSSSRILSSRALFSALWDRSKGYELEISKSFMTFISATEALVNYKEKVSDLSTIDKDLITEGILACREFCFQAVECEVMKNDHFKEAGTTLLMAQLQVTEIAKFLFTQAAFITKKTYPDIDQDAITLIQNKILISNVSYAHIINTKDLPGDVDLAVKDIQRIMAR